MYDVVSILFTLGVLALLFCYLLTKRLKSEIVQRVIYGDAVLVPRGEINCFVWPIHNLIDLPSPWELCESRLKVFQTMRILTQRDCIGIYLYRIVVNPEAKCHHCGSTPYRRDGAVSSSHTSSTICRSRPSKTRETFSNCY